MDDIKEELPKLPRNIRQIGEIEDMTKVYIEDYANIYLKKLRPVDGQVLKIGLLLGTSRVHEGIPYIYIEGAMEIAGMSATPDNIAFTNEIWKKAYEEANMYFEGSTILGWFICGSLDVKLDPLAVWNFHTQYFPGKNQVLYLNPTYELDESLYITSVNGFYNIAGHYIYYERNEAMQDYMVLRKEARRIEPDVDDSVIRNFRTVMQDKKEEVTHHRTVNLLYTACTFLTLVICAIGVTLINTHDKMKSMEAALIKLSQGGEAVLVNETPEQVEPSSGMTITETENGIVVNEIPGNVYPTTEAVSTNAQEESSSSPSTESSETIAETTVAETEPTAGIAPANAGNKTYIVKEGETLYAISLKLYSSIEPVEKICELNGMDNQDKIFVGQELQLP